MNYLEKKLFEAVRENDIEALHEILACDVDVDICNYEGCTPLHFAARVDNADCVKLLQDALDKRSRENLPHELIINGVRYFRVLDVLGEKNE